MNRDLVRNPHGPRASAGRVAAMVLRYWYLIRSSWPRVVELIYWPLVQMLLWGFLQLHLAETSNFYAKAAGLLIGAVLLWDILVRGQIGFSVSFLEEMWSRNIGNLLMSPLTANEFVMALMTISLIRIAFGVIPVALLAFLFFDFNLLVLGFALTAFFVNLVLTGWSLGLLTTGVVLRYGLGAEGFTWSVVFVLLPVCCVYYPVSTLPDWLQPVALSLAPTHVFEGMRSILIDGVFRAGPMWRAFALNMVYFAAGFVAFKAFLRSARIHGSLLQIGE